MLFEMLTLSFSLSLLQYLSYVRHAVRMIVIYFLLAFSQAAAILNKNFRIFALMQTTPNWLIIGSLAGSGTAEYLKCHYQIFLH